LISEHEILGIASADGIPVYARRMTKELAGAQPAPGNDFREYERGYRGSVHQPCGLRQLRSRQAFWRSLWKACFQPSPVIFLTTPPGSRIDVLMHRDTEELPVAGLTRPLELNGRQVIIRSFPVKAETDTTILLVTDVTEQRDLEYQLQHVRRMDAIGNLAGGIAHNFNNLMMGIQGNVSISHPGQEGGGPTYDELAGIERCIDSGAKLTRQLLSFAKGGRYSLDLLNVNDIVEKSSSMFARTRKEIHLDRHLEEDLVLAEVDSAQIELALDGPLCQRLACHVQWGNIDGFYSQYHRWMMPLLNLTTCPLEAT
jgi:two-component system cell cycle sensor histidine kinase/response regulator CckA